MPVSKDKELTLVEAFGKYSPKILSNGQLRSRCPFRENHTDGSGEYSFFASPEINAYHCFSCGAKGNLVSLLTSRLGVNYFEAVKLVHLNNDKPTEEKQFELDIKWEVTPPSDFLKRGFKPETLKHFGMGISGEYIVIPFFDDFNKKANLVGYQRRINYPDRKVFNSVGFHKREYLYNLDTSYSYTILVEGYSDVMRLYQFGYNATALLGADISKEQAEMLSQFDTVYLALDNDSAGRRATELAYLRLRNIVDVLLIPYTTKDPGECISKKLWDIAFRGSTDYLEYSMAMSVNWKYYLTMREDVERRIKFENYGIK